MNASQTLSGGRLSAALGLWQKLARNFWDNPVARKELRGRMRTARAFVTLSVYVGLLSLFLLGVYTVLVESSTFNPSLYSSAYSVEDIGGTLFGAVVGVEMVLIGLTVPTLTAVAISGEREQQTYDLLRTTLLPAQRLVFGKLLAALAYAALLLVVAVPLQSVAFFFGGVSALEVGLSLWVMALEALFLAALGLYFSARTRRTFSSKALTYAAAVVVVLGLPFLGGVMTLNLDPSSPQAPSTFTLYVAGTLLCFNPPLALLMTHVVDVQHQSLFVFTYTATNGQTFTLPAPWVVFSVLYVGMTAVLLFWAVRRVRRVEG